MNALPDEEGIGITAIRVFGVGYRLMFPEMPTLDALSPANVIMLYNDFS